MTNKDQMKILITGVAGFIGFSLAKDLLLTNKKVKIYGIDNFIVPISAAFCFNFFITGL